MIGSPRFTESIENPNRDAWQKQMSPAKQIIMSFFFLSRIRIASNKSFTIEWFTMRLTWQQCFFFYFSIFHTETESMEWNGCVVYAFVIKYLINNFLQKETSEQFGCCSGKKYFMKRNCEMVNGKSMGKGVCAHVCCTSVDFLFKYECECD